MVRPKVASFRWVGFGVDLRVVATDAGPLFVARDVCAALDIEVPEESDHGRWGERLLRRYPGHTTHVALEGDFHHPDFDDVYTLDDLVAVAHDNPSWATAIFLNFIDGITTPEALEEVKAADPEPALKELAAGLTYSVARAARILSRDPVIVLGQQSLFEAMRGFGWIARDHEIWVPADEQLRAGHLVRHRQRVGGWAPKQKIIYPQIRITRSGLEQLHKRLGGIATLTLDEAPDLTLVEL